MFSLGRFPEVGQKQKTEKKERKRKPKVCNNIGQLRIATPPRVVHAKPPGPKKKERERRVKVVITMASYALPMPPRVAHAKPPGPKMDGQKTAGKNAI